MPGRLTLPLLPCPRPSLPTYLILKTSPQVQSPGTATLRGPSTTLRQKEQHARTSPRTLARSQHSSGWVGPGAVGGAKVDIAYCRGSHSRHCLDFNVGKYPMQPPCEYLDATWAPKKLFINLTPFCLSSSPRPARTPASDPASGYTAVHACLPILDFCEGDGDMHWIFSPAPARGATPRAWCMAKEIDTRDARLGQRERVREEKRLASHFPRSSGEAGMPLARSQLAIDQNWRSAQLCFAHPSQDWAQKTLCISLAVYIFVCVAAGQRQN